MSTQRYLVTARKYRPQVFRELVSQEHVTETLKNAIRLDRLAHAYLFSGPRGVGKTTAARVLAKAINCTTPLEEREDGAEPCRQCDSCRSFEEGRSLSIIEIDAASNNKVEDVRELRETVRIPPQGSRKKVYIVDEVHMLSAAAFNALLKTLEEPPPYALFIFATTEPNKVLPTILSRCQRFDFRRIPVSETVRHLREICAAEGVEADEESLLLIARKGDGALRDALSAFDQAVSLCGMTLRYAELADAMRVVEVDLYFRLMDYIIAGDTAGVIGMVDEIVRGGYDLQEFLAGISEHIRNVLVARTMGDTRLIEATEETRQRFAATASQIGEADLLRMLTIADDTDRAFRTSVQPRLKLELALLKMTALPRSADLKAIIDKIERLEQQQGGGTGSSAPSGPAPGQRTSAADKSERAQSDVRSQAPENARNAAPAPSTVSTPAQRPANVHDLAPAAGRARPAESESPRTEPAPQSTPVALPGIFDAPALKRRKEQAPNRPDESSGGKAMFDGSGALATSPEPFIEPEALPAPGIRMEEWDAAVKKVQEDRIQYGALLVHCRPADYRKEILTITVPDDFHRRMLGSEDEYLLRQFEECMTLPVKRLRIIIDESLLQGVSTETAPQIDPLEYFNRKREENPVVRAIFEQFGGELVW